MEPVYTPVLATAVAMFKVMGWTVEVEGSHNVPAIGPAVMASNHIGYLDFIFVGFGARPAGRLVRFAAKKEVFEHPIMGPLMRGMKHLPVDRDGDVGQIMDLAHERLVQGQIVGMFPEGTISRSFMPAAAKTGTARMAIQAGAPLLPVAVWGCQRIMTKAVKRNFRRGYHINIAIGQAIPYTHDDEPREVMRRLMDRISEMVVDLQDRYPQSPADEADRYWLPSRLGGTAPTPEEAAEMARQERIARRLRRKAAREAAEASAKGVPAGDTPDPVRRLPPTQPPSAQPPEASAG